MQVAIYTVHASGCDETVIGTAFTMADGIIRGYVIHVQADYDPGGETYPLNFLDTSTTLACDPGVMIR